MAALPDDPIVNRVADATVMLTRSVRDITTRASGGALAVRRPDDGEATYIVTNGHAIADGAIGEMPHPVGSLIDGEYYYPLRDRHRNLGFGRLVSYSMGGDCLPVHAEHQVDNTVRHHDLALLEVLDRQREPARFEHVWSAIDPASWAADRSGRRAIEYPREFSIGPYDAAAIETTRLSDRGAYVNNGYAVSGGGKMVSTTGEYDRQDIAEEERSGKRSRAGEIRLSFAAGHGVEPGDSGSLVVDARSGLPVGVMVSVGFDNQQGFALPIEEALRNIHRIETLRSEGHYVTVSPQVALCEHDQPEAWLDATPAFHPSFDRAYAERLRDSIERYRQDPVRQMGVGEANVSSTPANLGGGPNKKALPPMR